MHFSFFLENEIATKRFAQDLALALKPGDLVTMQGDLGTGKTTIARTIIHTLAHDNTLYVPSPTFTLVQSYQLPQFEIIHADLYRLSMVEEIYELGLHETREQSIMLIEWPKKGADFLEPVTFALTLQHEGCGRYVTLISVQHSTERLQQAFANRTFLKTHKHSQIHCHFLADDTSACTYELLDDK
ncbi:YjeE family ATPase [Bartonella alsatica IBS 382]|uniref:tRNA threonylcarbamoyladenosine biosynthesis protein TsaE n=1 Tax=Bartonella alsatica IBS 382 TaxID=1094551 RepID=J1ITV6_9HYPH|nr:YjeE family ATPase [Bartonella alsatica IBS 382]